jgi:hypothetical protein
MDGLTGHVVHRGLDGLDRADHRLGVGVEEGFVAGSRIGQSIVATS